MGDCDDLCASRCPGATESCDGIDNDCTDTSDHYVDENGYRTLDLDGIPDAMLEDVDVAGTVSMDEFDLDMDGYLNCDDFSAGSEQVHSTSAGCAEQVLEADLLVDCNNQCALTNPRSKNVAMGSWMSGGEAEGSIRIEMISAPAGLEFGYRRRR